MYRNSFIKGESIFFPKECIVKKDYRLSPLLETRVVTETLPRSPKGGKS